MKKILSVLLCTAMILGASPYASAYKLPNSFWAPNAKYEQALNGGDHSGIIEYGNKLIEIMSAEPDCPERTDILITRLNEVGLSYAALGDYGASAKTFERLYEFSKDRGDGYYDYMRGAKARAEQYTPSVSMYTDRGTSPYYGAKNEKENGVLFGICSNGATRNELEDESMVLVYQEFGYAVTSYTRSIVRKASEAGIAVEFALNCPNEADDIRNVKNMNGSLDEISDMLSEYPDVPVYLRFAAEFDIWENQAAPEEFIDAFRYVSGYFKSRNGNVAMVWSSNQVSKWDTDAGDFYPGDEYVDWVGISLYAQRYFLDGGGDDMGTLYFRTGDGSDPVIAVRDIVERYGDRKPIMIAECGCGHRIVTSGENTEDFALTRLRQYFSYLPMIYPQIKLMAYFDWYIEGSGERNDFRLSTNTALKKEFLRLTRGERFIHGGFNGETGVCMRPVYNGMTLGGVFEVSCYAHRYGDEVESVSYYLDGEYMDASAEMPYTVYIDASKCTGTHKLTALAAFRSGEVLETGSDVTILGANGDISVEISSERIDFDVAPVIYNDRTMVPMRRIFEELGAEVTWDAETRTAVGKRGAETVELSIGRRFMLVNGTKTELDAAPIVIGGRTLVPVRAVAEGMDCRVDWDAEHRLVSITEK